MCIDQDTCHIQNCPWGHSGTRWRAAPGCPWWARTGKAGSAHKLHTHMHTHVEHQYLRLQFSLALEGYLLHVMIHGYLGYPESAMIFASQETVCSESRCLACSKGRLPLAGVLSLVNPPALRYSAELRNSGLPARKLGLLLPFAVFLPPFDPCLGPPGTPLLRLGCCWGAADCTCTCK